MPYINSIRKNHIQPKSEISFTDVFEISGGDSVMTLGGYRVHTFTSEGESQFSIRPKPGVPQQMLNLVSNTLDVEYLVVAGGGGSGGELTGGGGAGGFLTGSQTLPNADYTVNVGAGGAGNPGPDYTYGDNGGPSTFNDITATGGGASGSQNSPATYVGRPGGSGAGGVTGAAGGSGIPGQGNPGGSSGGPAPNYPGGGGGGAGSAGTSSPGTSAPGGPGGNGLTNSFEGTVYYFAAGGGGGSYTGPAGGGNGGLGGGGGGSADSGPVGLAGGQSRNGDASNGQSGNCLAGKAATNSGSGSGGNANQSVPDGNGPNNGGPGIVIVRYAE